jgi:hypothetical protein
MAGEFFGLRAAGSGGGEQLPLQLLDVWCDLHDTTMTPK